MEKNRRPRGYRRWVPDVFYSCVLGENLTIKRNWLVTYYWKNIQKMDDNWKNFSAGRPSRWGLLGGQHERTITNYLWLEFPTFDQYFFGNFTLIRSDPINFEQLHVSLPLWEFGHHQNTSQLCTIFTSFFSLVFWFFFFSFSRPLFLTYFFFTKSAINRSSLFIDSSSANFLVQTLYSNTRVSSLRESRNEQFNRLQGMRPSDDVIDGLAKDFIPKTAVPRQLFRRRCSISQGAT